MEPVAFEKSIALKKLSENAYESIHTPFWTWPKSQVVPGGMLMSLAAAAAYETVDQAFAIDTLHTYFLAGPKPNQLVQIRIQRLNDGGRFLTREVTLEQAGIAMAHVTCSFVRTSAMGGPSMTHSIHRSTTHTIDTITLDDLEPGRNSSGPIMRFQRFPLTHHNAATHSSLLSPDKITYTSAAHIYPPISLSDPIHDRKLHALGIIALSDYHILDAPPTLHAIPFGQPAINDAARTPRRNAFERFTSLNHTIRFHRHDGFRADEMCYIEVTSPWTRSRRAEVDSRIFTKDGELVAGCVQGAYYVLKADEKQDGSKL